MEVFRDLYVSADAEQMAAATEQIERSLPAGWTRDRALEAKARAVPVAPRLTYCFACTKEGRRPAAMLILAQKAPGSFYISNILPSERHQLSYAEYNSVLEDFYQKVFRPYAEQVGLESRMTAADVGLEQWMSDETAEKLRQFSACANKSTAWHANDRERWNEFVLSAHRERSRLDSSTLRRWLVEVDEWSAGVAEQLAFEYDYGRELLAFAEGRRRSA